MWTGPSSPGSTRSGSARGFIARGDPRRGGGGGGVRKKALPAGRENDVDRPEQPGIDPERVVTRIYLQSGYTDRKKERRSFRKTAKDMAPRHPQQTPPLAT